MIRKLQVGDNIRVYNPLMGPDGRLYPVTKVEGNRAFTGFRTFNTKVHVLNRVYEFGKRLSPIYNNDYYLEESE